MPNQHGEFIGYQLLTTAVWLFPLTSPRVGHSAWNELITTDPEAAKAFCLKAFGWTRDGDMYKNERSSMCQRSACF